MLSVVIPTLQAGGTLGATLDAVTAATGVGEVLVVDAGSTDATRAIATRAGARVIAAPRGRGMQLAAGAAAATGDWLLFLHADTVPAPGWDRALAGFIDDPASRERAAVFCFALDDPSPAARRLERWVDWRTRGLGLPYGDQGLLIARDFYAAVGGFSPMPLMEDVDLARRIGRSRLAVLDAAAVTSAVRYRNEGYMRRGLRNLVCLSLFFLGVDPKRIERLYR
ncbi:TIGR04283 family arsenosugar biosynthesis glycosyltransferase [Shumkonia mesophila]|uniref:TIGR04283 family arsenosugar biosynthesis glycosyltransferase n=1 Tax=Shumkonia mesophila TaxID=2838854 RepID=UPI002934A96D|nr:TIGR04283 family arsenosugar biosynthesis glycosyltransferase [Shumkonia mesophila]